MVQVKKLDILSNVVNILYIFIILTIMPNTEFIYSFFLPG